MKQNISPKVLNLAESSHLGALTGRYGVYFKRDLNNNIAVVLGTSAILGALGTCCWFVSPDAFGDPLGNGIRIAIILLGAFLWFGIFYISILSTYLARETCVYLFSDGLIYQEKKQTEVVFWKQIKRIKISKDVTDNNCSILLVDGNEIVFSNEIANLHDLAEEIKSHPRTSVSSLEKVIEGKRVRKKKVENNL